MKYPPAPFRFHPGPALPQEHRVSASGGRTHSVRRYPVDSVRHEYADFNQSCDRQDDNPEECARHYPEGFEDRLHLSNSYYHIIKSFFGAGSDAAGPRRVQRKALLAGEAALSVENRVVVIMNAVLQLPNS